MFLTKIWSVLVTLFAVAVTAAFLLSTTPAEFELREAYVRSLDGAQGLVDNQLRTRSRQRLDFFNEVGKDYKIVKLLKQLKGKNEADGATDSKELTAYAQGKLVGAGGEAAFRRNFDVVAFTDVEGRAWARLGAEKVWSRLGSREGKVGDKIHGFPGVKRALTERVCADNTLDLGGVLHFVWACPVRYVKEGAPVEFVGAVMGIKEIDDAFALAMLAVIGETDASATSGETEPKDAMGADAMGADAMGADAMGAKGAKGAKSAAAAKAKAEAAEKAKAEAAKKAAGRKLKLNIAFFRQGKTVAKSSDVPLWAEVAKVYAEHKATIDDVAIGRSPAMELSHGGTRYLLVVGRLPGEAAGQGNVWAILWAYPTKLGPMAFTKSKIPRSALFGHMSWPIFVPIAVIALFFTVFFLYLEGDRPIRRLLNQTRDLAAGKLERLEDTHFRGRFGSIARSVNEAVEKFTDARPTKPALHDKDLESILGGPDVTDQDFSLAGDAKAAGAGPPPPPPGPDAGPPPPPPDLPPPPPGARVPSGSFGVPGGAPIGTIPGPGPQGPPPAPAPVSPEEAKFREIFSQFVATKKQCGEAVDALTFEAFVTKLRTNEDAVKQKTGCAAVEFKVYVKDGKAALKATPVK